MLVDAFVVRMTITPAVLTLLGDKAWWMPKWLDKLVPNMDVEGATLLEELEHKDSDKSDGGDEAPSESEASDDSEKKETEAQESEAAQEFAAKKVAEVEIPWAKKKTE